MPGNRVESASTAGSSAGNLSSLYSTIGELGVKELASPAGADTDIIFIHGITGNRESTWTHGNRTLWPRDLLVNDFPKARIMSFGYDADAVKLWTVRPAGSNDLRDHGKSLANGIAEWRADVSVRNRPIVFIVHSMGGLVCEQALILCNTSNEDRLSRILNSTVGILFMGTPHRGSSLATWGSTLAKYLNMVRRVNRDIVKSLEVTSPVLRAVQEEFQKILLKPEHRDRIRIFCFYEELAIPLVGMIVPKDSAIFQQYPNTSIHANHMDMTKFSDANDPGYCSVRGILQDWIGSLNAERAASIAQLNAATEDSAAGAVHNTWNMNSQGGPQFQGGSLSGNTFTWGK